MPASCPEASENPAAQEQSFGGSPRLPTEVMSMELHNGACVCGAMRGLCADGGRRHVIQS